MTAPAANRYSRDVRERAPWNIPSVIDFECLLAADARADEERLRERDREIFHRAIQPGLTPGKEAKRSTIFRAWLSARRSEEEGTSPGEHIAAGWQMLVMLGGFVGLVMGFSVTAAFLHYKGVEPVNVSWFLVCTVGVQMVVFIAAALLWFVRRSTNLLDDFYPLRWALSMLVWSFSAGLRRLPGEQRERLRGALAALSRKREIYGSLAVWPFLIVTQFFAVGFNVGILGVLLSHVAFTDLDFGWQSTFISSPEAVHRLVWLISLPWHWVPSAYPSLTDITNSHFAYKPGMGGLNPAALKSWWPFLAYTVAFYGLTLRTSLLIFAGVKLQRALQGLTFDHEGCNALFRRLTGPMVVPQANTAVLEIPASAPVPIVHVTRPGECIALVATDSDLDEMELASYAHAKFGWHLKQTLPASIDHPSGNPAIMEALAQSASSLAGVLVIARSKRSPIKAIAIFLQKVTAAAGSKPETVLLLIGRKEGDIRARVPDDEFGHWRNFHAINSLRLSLERWTTS